MSRLWQVTGDGIPVIWHDDNVLTFSGESGLPHLRRICELTLEDFKQLSPAHNSHSSPRLQDHFIEESGCSGNSSLSNDRLGSHSSASTSAAELPCTGLGRVFNSAEGKRMSHAMRWAVSEDDELPTLAEVFQVGSRLPPMRVTFLKCSSVHLRLQIVHSHHNDATKVHACSSHFMTEVHGSDSPLICRSWYHSHMSEIRKVIIPRTDAVLNEHLGGAGSGAICGI